MSIKDFTVNEIVWAKLKGHPWWPARIKEQQQLKSRNKDDINSIRYKVNFINDNSHAKILYNQVKKFKTYYNVYSNKKGSKLQSAIQKANQATDKITKKVKLENPLIQQKDQKRKSRQRSQSEPKRKFLYQLQPKSKFSKKIQPFYKKSWEQQLLSLIYHSINKIVSQIITCFQNEYFNKQLPVFENSINNNYQNDFQDIQELIFKIDKFKQSIFLRQARKLSYFNQRIYEYSNK